MANFTLPRFELPSNWIQAARDHNVSWEEILTARTGTDEGLSSFLNDNSNINFWPALTVQEWKGLVLFKKSQSDLTKRLNGQGSSAIIHDSHQDNDVTIPTSRTSAWQLYKSKLLNEKHFKEESVNEMERSCIKILKCLSRDTTQIGPIKGLVMGSVQSGKTANMAGIMAMAADWGWNMFIILSGTIESLRQQTQKRLFNDLNNRKCQLTWQKLSLGSTTENQAQDLNFEGTSLQRYMTVCLKQSDNLSNLIQWLHRDGNSQKQMKVLVIEDESDQASINTNDIDSDERSRINGMLCNLVNGRKVNGDESNSHFQAMNYIGYSATPYANVLNEAGIESLYPRSFITTLKPSDEYFGPQQIFGIEGGEYDGLDIICKIPTEEERIIQQINDAAYGTIIEEAQTDIEEIRPLIDTDGNIIELPNSFADSICWFLCGTALMRFWEYKKPISMLVHTSQRTDCHAKVSMAISYWFVSHTEKEILDMCHNIWNREVHHFNKSKLREQYPNYGVPDIRIKDYPEFEVIRPYLESLLRGNRITHIKMDAENNPQYHEGVHLCIDNCHNNGTVDGIHMRVFYPEKELDFAPAFIVVGGNTISRGLTLEGLISTYFLRTPGQADTLMQMGRWFGFRVGYEIIPRIWLTDRTSNLFNYLSSLDQELRDEIREMEVLGKLPSEYGPRVLNSPRRFRITAKNRTQRAEPTDLDFSGTFLQTYLFDTNRDILQRNLDLTSAFLSNLGTPSRIKSCVAQDYVWRNVQFDVVREYIEQYQFQPRMKTLNNINPLLEWVGEVTSNGNLKDWNIVLAGINNPDASDFNFGTGYTIKKVHRTRLIKNAIEGVINIGVLRSSKDIMADIDLDSVSVDLRNEILSNSGDSAKILRTKAGLGNVPQLIVYIVDRDSRATNSSTREDLNSGVDIAGICINIPGDTMVPGHTTAVSIHLKHEDKLIIDNCDING